MARKKAANGNGADPDEAPPARQNTKSDDAADCFIAIKELKSGVARLNQRIGATYARYENMGVDTDMVKACLKLEKEEDAPEYVRRLVDMASILKIVPVEFDEDGQASALAVVKPGTSAVSAPMSEKLDLHRAFWAGHDFAYDGGEKSGNPHEPGTAIYVDWEKGWNDGAEDLSFKKPDAAAAQNTGRAATREPETALEKDEATYRNGGTIHSESLTTLPADPV